MQRPSNGWSELLKNEFIKPYFLELENKVDAEYSQYTVFPPAALIFEALNKTAYDDVKIVILGQDPYHGDAQANGMAFAVNDGIDLPPSLKNIYAEIENEYNIKMPRTGSLNGWAKQGVLLLNTSLSVRKASPQSHSEFGWQIFTDAVIAKCAERQKSMVFMLWGSNAIRKSALIPARHLTLTAPHPSPLSAYRGFFGCNHFIKANEFLTGNNMPPVDFTDIDGSEPEYYKYSGNIRRA